MFGGQVFLRCFEACRAFLGVFVAAFVTGDYQWRALLPEFSADPVTRAVRSVNEVVQYRNGQGNRLKIMDQNYQIQ